jgi:phosphohistidine phosphatase
LDLVSPFFARPPQLLIEDDLYLAGAHELLARLRKVPAPTASVMLIGHNPGFHELAIFLSQVGHGPLVARLAGFPTGAMASYELGVPWAGLDRRCARLTAVILPKELLRDR